MLLILVLVAVADCGKLKSEFLNPENISPQERVVKSKHLDSWSLGFGLSNFVNAVENNAGNIKEKFGQTLGTIKDKFINIKSDLQDSIYLFYFAFYSNYYRQNSIQDEFEKTPSNNSDNPQARLFLEPNEVEFGLGLVEDYIKNKPGLREIGEEIGNTVGTIKDEVGNTVADRLQTSIKRLKIQLQTLINKLKKL